jgi:Flp pilus assembly protein TadG
VKRIVDRDRRGQALVLSTLSLFMLFGLMGLAVDLGWSYYRKQVAQTATDSGALAAAVVAENSTSGVITCGVNNVACQSATACPTITGSPASNLQNGCLYSQANGFANSGNQTLTIASGASGLTPDPTKYSVLYWVTVTATETNPQLFSGLLGNTSGQIQAQSTAEVVQLPEPGCIYALNQTASKTLSLNGGGKTDITVTGCGVYVNSNASDALNLVGQSQIVSGFVDIVGGYRTTGGSSISPTPKTGTSVIYDPLASLASPSQPTSCDYTNGGGSSSTLNPGTYCGGISINGNNNITFNPGIYDLYGGGLSINSAATTVTGSGVMFYNTDGHGIPGLPTSNYAGISIGGNANVTLSAPTSGTWNGILFMKDRLVSSNNNSDFLGGNVSPTLSGTIYFPGDALTMVGGSGITVGSNVPAIIADTITVSGGSFFVQSGTGAGQYHFAALVQ